MKRRDRLTLKTQKKQKRIARKCAREEAEAAIVAAFTDNMPARPGRPGLTVLIENIPLPGQMFSAGCSGNGAGLI